MKRARKIPFTAAALTHLLIEVFLLMHVAILPRLIREFKFSIIQAGLLVTVPSIVRIILNFPMGVLSDTVNPRYLLSASALLSGLGALVVSQSPTPLLLVLGLCLLMTAVSMYHPPGMSLVSKTFPEEKVTTMIGVHGASGNIGQALGIFSLSLLLSSFGWRYCYRLWAIPLLIWGLLIWIVLSDSHFEHSSSEKTDSDNLTNDRKSVNGWRKALAEMMLRRNFLILLIVMSLFGLGFKGILSFTTTFFVQVRGLSEEFAALFFGMGPVIGLFGSLSGGTLDRKWVIRNFFLLLSLGWRFLGCF